MIPFEVDSAWYPKYGNHEGSAQDIRLNEMIVAKLKDGGGYAPAQPYQADLLADDWELL